MLAPIIHMPGTVLPPMAPRGPCDQTFTMPSAFGRASRAAVSRASETGIGTAVPTRAIFATRSGKRAAASRLMSEPMLWPTSVAACTPAASSRATIQSACASTLGSSGPSERPWPGRSTASTEQPWWANQRLCRPHTLWSFSAPWMKTTVGRAGLKGLPPV